MKPKISIIIVNYKVKEELFECIDSIYSSKPKTPFEIIIVDNDEVKTIEKDLRKKFPKARYIESEKNLGFGGGNNLGAKFAKGEYLFFLNPDTRVLRNSIDNLFNFIKSNKNIGIVSPLLVDSNLSPFKTQSKKELTPISALYSFSLLRKLFPYKSIYNDKFFDTWDRSIPIETDTIPGAAIMVSKKLFDKVSGFDERFFLYFEENDLSRRIKNLDYKLFINPKSKIIHKVGQSTKQVKNRDKYFTKSRFLYLKKHYGLIKSLPLELILRLNKKILIVFIILIISAFLRTINLSINMPFIGDQGWFYLSARDLLINGKIPLVGITSSHTWLHQGPLWTYMLSVALLISKFNPVSGAVLTASFGIMATFLMYKLGSSMFSEKVGLISAALYAVSPLVIFFDRMPFDPSPIPFFTILYFFAISKWLKNNINYFPLIILFLAILYNLELATFTLFFPLILLFIYRIIKNKDWAKRLLNRKTVIYSLTAFIIPMFPVIVYDFSNGFKQTVIFLGWTFYKPFSFLIKHSSGNFFANLKLVLEFLGTNLQKLIYEYNLVVAVSVFIISISFLSYLVFKNKRNIVADPRFILLLLLFFSLGGILINQSPSDAYLPIIFPFVLFTTALFFEFLLAKEKTRYAGGVILLVILVSNFYFAYKNSFVPYFENKIKAVDEIISVTKGQEYNLIGKGPGSQFTSFTMNYEYLLWWKGHPPVKSKVGLKVIVSETPKGIIINKRYD